LLFLAFARSNIETCIIYYAVLDLYFYIRITWL
jgi:hypothetical protein